MTDKLANDIQHRFPLLYREKLVWGFECGDGWADLLQKLSAKLEKLIAKLPPAQQAETYAVQVKQKFGGLRFYLVAPSEAMWHAILTAEDDAYRTCEQCGAPGRCRKNGGWLLTLCDSCRAAK